MLQLLTGLEVIMAGGGFRLLADIMTPAEGGQGGIGDVGPTADQFLMDPDEIAFVTGQQFQDLNPVGFGFLGADQYRQRR